MPVLVAAVVTMTAAQLLDLATFMAMLDVAGPSAEANPLVAAMFRGHGLPLVAIAKVALLALTTGVAVVLSRSPRRAGVVTLVTTVGILLGLLGGISNLLVIATA